MSQPHIQRPSTAPSSSAHDPMLRACRDIAVKMLTESLEQFFVRLEETYFQLADTSFDRRLRDDFFAARIETHNKRQQLASQFKTLITEAFEQRVSNPATQPEQKFYFVNANLDQLSLVANEEYEESIAADQVVKSIKHQGGEELDQLEQRFERLHADKNPDFANPMAPEAICDAFLQACKQLETGVEARMVAMKAFEKELSSQVANVYHQVNQYLIKQNVQPLVVRSAPRRSPSRQGEAGETSERTVKPVNHSPSALADHLSELTLPASSPALQAPVAQNVTELGASLAVPSTAALSLEGQTPEWKTFLDLLQHKGSSELAQLSQDPLEQGINLIAMLRESGWAKQLPQLNAMTLELVAMLFEHIFDDPRLNSVMKSLIGRLQIPILKVAMLDASFFAQKNHPARLLVDQLALCAMDDETLQPGQPHYEKLAEIVQHLIKHFDQDVGVFAQSYQALQDYLQSLEAAAIATLSEELDHLAANERAELAQVTAEQLIQARLQGYSDLAQVIQDFLAITWQEALRLAYGTEAENTPMFVTRLQAMDDLLWSVQPKATPEERFKMVNLLTPMLKTLEEGALAAGLDKTAANAFFAELVQCHAAAIRNGIKPAARVEVHAPVEPTPISVAPVIVSTSPAVPVQPAAAVSQPEVTTTATTELVEQLSGELDSASDEEVSPDITPESTLPRKGEWVDWQTPEGHFIRLRLSWISPQGTRYVFTNRTEKGRAFLQAELLNELYSGRMQRLDQQATLTDRAMQELMSDLRA